MGLRLVLAACPSHMLCTQMILFYSQKHVGGKLMPLMTARKNIVGGLDSCLIEKNQGLYSPNSPTSKLAGV